MNQATRDSLARVADEMGGVSLDEALRSVLFDHESYQALARLQADPQAWADYRAETRQVAEGGVEVRD